MGAVTGFARPGDGWLHHLHPIPKLLLLIAAVLAPFALPATTIPILIAAVLIAALTAHLGTTYLRAVLLAGAVAVASIVVVNGLFYPGSHRAIVSIGRLALTEEGLAFALPIAGRLVVAIAAAVAFAVSTRPDDLMEGLVQVGVNQRLSFVVLLAIQAIPRMLERGRRILDAQAARGLPVAGSLVTRGRAVVPLLGPLVVGSLVDVRDRTLALEARAFGSWPDRTAYRVLRRRRLDVAIAWLALAALAALLGVVVGRAAGLIGG